MHLDTLRRAVDYPVLRDPGFNVEPELGRSVVRQRCLGHLDDQQYVVAVRLELLVWHRATANDLDIGLRLGVVVENDWILDRNDGPAGDAHRQELVQIVDECPMTPAIWRHLDRGARATVAPALRPAVLP